MSSPFAAAESYMNHSYTTDVSAAAILPVFETGANIIGGIFGAVGLFQWIKGLVPDPPKGVTNVGITVGQTADNPEKDGPYNMAGNIPAISVYSVAGNLVASSNGDRKKTWKAGSKNSISMENNGAQDSVGSEYVSVVATGTNAICISAVGLKNPNDEISYGWFSDVGVSCGMQFHWSETIVGNSGTQGYRPNCVWITGPSSKNDVTTQGFSMHIIDFSKVTQAQADAFNGKFDLMCGSAPRFSAWTTMLPDISPPVFIPSLRYNADRTDLDASTVLVPGFDKTDYGRISIDKTGQPTHPVRLPTPESPIIPPDYPAERNEKRKSPIRPKSMHHTLISSRYPEHSAKHLCSSATSWGTDVVSETEGLFCDMDQKQLWPLCERKSQMSCFDTKTNVLRGRSAERAVVPEKRYLEVKRWGSAE
ncbi:hypothetical protein ONS95_001277 [Cadophora gregata]|uniref:uncharacterized protein n=1 Tax=Cadophora gregata TaxID=51156 RepID=UPI0026DC5ED4|nr:uncharacterized protein ONS95_001277 [Cadophora gregata]KAK0129349.1 hypothetical protein ONS95_001277 [Cadophora gregata]